MNISEQPNTRHDGDADKRATLDRLERHFTDVYARNSGKISVSKCTWTNRKGDAARRHLDRVATLYRRIERRAA